MAEPNGRGGWDLTDDDVAEIQAAMLQPVAPPHPAPTGDPYTDDDVQRYALLIADEHGSDAFGPNPGSGEYAEAEREQYRAEVCAVLDALAADGRLLPTGGETRVEWGVQRYREIGPESAGFGEGSEWLARQSAAAPGYVLLTREHRTWPDGTKLRGPWTPVEA